MTGPGKTLGITTSFGAVLFGNELSSLLFIVEATLVAAVAAPAAASA
jgi:hypothetical protein